MNDRRCKSTHKIVKFESIVNSAGIVPEILHDVPSTVPLSDVILKISNSERRQNIRTTDSNQSSFQYLVEAHQHKIQIRTICKSGLAHDGRPHTN